MELKKNPRYDLTAKAGLFRLIGLNLSLLIVIVAFEVPDKGDQGIIELTLENENITELIEIPPTEQTPPPPPKVQAFDVKEIPDEVILEEDIEIELDVEVLEQTVIQDIVFEVQAPAEEEVDEVFTVVEDQPEFPGGMEAFYKFVGEELKYPSQARRLGIEGRVFVQFVVDKTGEVTNVTLVRGIGAGCDEEAVRVMKLIPNFKPGKQRGKPVKVQMIVPIYFKMFRRDE
jgi:protein TonB